MWIARDVIQNLENSLGYYIQILIGPRQCGKSSLFAYLGGQEFTEITFDDLQLRNLANQDPALFLSNYSTPLILDEAQYVPVLFAELKKQIDALKKQKLLAHSANEPPKVLFRLTGSNQILLDNTVKETLVGRASYFYLNTLSVHEITKALPSSRMDKLIFKGGLPELHSNPNLNVLQFLNDYIRHYIEKDIVLSAGIMKQREFHTVLGLLAARTGEFLNYSDIAKDSGVRSVTVREWVSVLERSQIVYLLQPSVSNLNKRLIKMPKIYFLDTGIAARLQGWMESRPMMQSPQAGHLFETLVCAEIIKCMHNFAKDWHISVWRTKEGEEVDFIIETKQGAIALDVKMAIHNATPLKLSKNIQKALPIKQVAVVTLGGNKMYLDKTCLQIPIRDLTEFLLEHA